MGKRIAIENALAVFLATEALPSSLEAVSGPQAPARSFSCHGRQGKAQETYGERGSVGAGSVAATYHLGVHLPELTSQRRRRGAAYYLPMLLVVLGAGASFDSVSPSVLRRIPKEQQLEWRPPLAKDLFADRRSFEQVLNGLPQCAALVADLQRRLENNANLEQELEHLQDEAASYPPRHRELAALRLYLQEMLWGCSVNWKTLSSGRIHYADLVRRIDRWSYEAEERVCVATFNYDLLFDDAAVGQLGLSLSSINGYVTGERYKYIKLHGSVNWGRRVPAPRGCALLQPRPCAPRSDRQRRRAGRGKGGFPHSRSGVAAIGLLASLPALSGDCDPD